MANSPVDTLRNKTLKVTIWENKSKDKKKTFFTANLTKSYKVGDQWKETTQLTGNEISRAGALLNQASKRVAELEIEAAA